MIPSFTPTSTRIFSRSGRRGQRVFVPMRRWGKQTGDATSKHNLSCRSLSSSSSSSSFSNATNPTDGRFPPIPELYGTIDASLTTTMQPHYDDQTPVVLRNLLLHTTTIKSVPKNAGAMLELFPHWDYWQLRVPATSDCHVELGGNYSQSQIVDMPFHDYLAYLRVFEDRFGRRKEHQQQATTKDDDDDTNDTNLQKPGPEDLIYLAQNDVFPEVMEDIEVPSFVMELGEGKLYSTMLWMGPYGCVSPLHYDPLDNLLMQFVGIKHVVVCAPSSLVNAGSEGNQVNTSPINPEYDADLPADVNFFQTTLYPGDALFLPKKWYHYLRTVETSISINTWFR